MGSYRVVIVDDEEPLSNSIVSFFSDRRFAIERRKVVYYEPIAL